MLQKDWIPPRSPYGLIQEDVWPNEWLILVCCMMLNCTTRKQVEKVLPTFLNKWPSPQEFLNAERQEIVITISPLGFGNRRADNLIKMTKHFSESSWERADQLPGIGLYASTAWEIFCQGIFRDVEPKDGALKVYWNWYRRHYGEEKIDCRRETRKAAA